MNYFGIDKHQFLTERVLNQCWHEFAKGKCIKCSALQSSLPTSCNSSYRSSNTYPNFDTWHGFPLLFKAAQNKPWWNDFIRKSEWNAPSMFVLKLHQGLIDTAFSSSNEVYMNIQLIDPFLFSNALFKYLVEKEGSEALLKHLREKEKNGQ